MAHPFVISRNRPVAELATERLEQIPTQFGRLIYLARCRGTDGRYTHEGLQTTHEARAVHAALLKAHKDCFQAWLELPVSRQHEDLSSYLEGLNRGRVLKAWGDSEPWHAIAPPTAEEHERALFAADFRVLLTGVLSRE